VDELVIVEQDEGVSSAAARAMPWAIAVFLTISIAGLYYVKWSPYFHKALAAAAQHTIGASIITGKSAAPPGAGWQAAWSFAVAYFNAVWQALIVGLLIGSGVQVLLPRAWLARVLGQKGFLSTVIAGGASVPSMMCTCCAAPVAVGLGKSRASTGATVAYWLGNPILNPATMVFTGFVLGWHWVALRIVAGMTLVLGVAYLAERTSVTRRVAANPPVGRAIGDVDGGGSLIVRWAQALWQLSVGLIPEYIIIVLGLGAIRAWIFPALNPVIGHSLPLMLLLAVVGTLFVVPTAGEIPIVQTLMAFGLGAGGAAVLLTTLPSLSFPSLLMMGKVVPGRVLVLAAAAVACIGLLAGGAAQLLGF